MLQPDQWQAGWYSLAHRLDSPNFSQRPDAALVDLIVLHSISLPPGIYNNNNVQAFFTNRLDWNAHPYFAQIRDLQVSAHFFIQRNGVLWQFVSCADRAWHAGQSSYRGRINCNDDSIGIELEGLEGEIFEPVQYATLAALCVELSINYPIAHIAGHEHIAPGRKIDPGPGFEWGRLRALLGWEPQYFPLGTAA